MRFVKPETVRLDLSEGDWIEIKRDLSRAEQIRLDTAGLGNRTGSTVAIDYVAMAYARITTYLLDWSFKGPDGKDAPITKAALENLSGETFDEIDGAILKHIEAREEEKKLPKPSPISTAPSAS